MPVAAEPISPRSPVRDPAPDPYADFARFYDDFTAHHDYETWMGTLEGLARRHGLEGDRVLDVACGTGKSFLPLLARGYRVSACDASSAMLERAAAKVPPGREVELSRADMRDLPGGRFDLVTCIDDAVNYLLEPTDLEEAFHSAAECLRPGGVYLFDVNTLRAYRSAYAADEYASRADVVFVFHGESSPDAGPGEVFTAVVEVFHRRAPDCWGRVSSRHVQRHHPEAVVRDALRTAGFHDVGVYGQHRDGRVDPFLDETSHTKAVYIARRAAS